MRVEDSMRAMQKDTVALPGESNKIAAEVLDSAIRMDVRERFVGCAVLNEVIWGLEIMDNIERRHCPCCGGLRVGDRGVDPREDARIARDTTGFDVCGDQRRVKASGRDELWTEMRGLNIVHTVRMLMRSPA